MSVCVCVSIETEANNITLRLCEMKFDIFIHN